MNCLPSVRDRDKSISSPASVSNTTVSIYGGRARGQPGPSEVVDDHVLQIVPASPAEAKRYGPAPQAVARR